MRRKDRSRNRFDRALGFTLGIGMVLVLVLGLVFSIAYGSQKISAGAASLHTADEVLRASTVVRAQLALATHFAAVDEQFGSNSDAAIETSLIEANAGIQELASGFAILLAAEPGRTTGVERATEQFIQLGQEVSSLLETGDVAAAQLLATNDLPTAFSQSVRLVELLRDDLAADVEESDILLGKIGTLTRFLVAFMVPVTVMVVYRELLRRQHRQVELEGRLETERQIAQSREEFIANASHELRTPLTGIYGLAQLLEEEPDIQASDTSREMVEMIITEASDLGRMVEDLLTAARLDAGAMHYTYDDIIVQEEMEEATGNVTRAGMSVAINVVPAMIRVDQMRFRQILRNLLSNAGKYGGSDVRIDGYIDGHTYLITVSDDGPGMGPKVAERLFQRFTHHGSGTAVQCTRALALVSRLCKPLFRAWAVPSSMSGPTPVPISMSDSHSAMSSPTQVE